MKTLCLIFGLVGQATLGFAADANQGLTVTDAWLRLPAPGAHTGALYMTLHNASANPLDITGITVANAGSAELHETTQGANGMMGMRPLPHLILAPGATVALKPGAVHGMVYDLAPPLAAGAAVPVRLKLAEGADVTVSATSRAP